MRQHPTILFSDDSYYGASLETHLCIQLQIFDFYEPISNLRVDLADIELARFEEMAKRAFEDEREEPALDRRREGECGQREIE